MHRNLRTVFTMKHKKCIVSILCVHNCASYTCTIFINFACARAPFNTHPSFSWFPWLRYFVTFIWMLGQNLGTPGLVLHLPERHQGLCTAWQGLPWFGEVHFTVMTSATWKMAQLRCWPSSGCDSLHGRPGPPQNNSSWGVSTVPTDPNGLTEPRLEAKIIAPR